MCTASVVNRYVILREAKELYRVLIRFFSAICPSE